MRSIAPSSERRPSILCATPYTDDAARALCDALNAEGYDLVMVSEAGDVVPHVCAAIPDLVLLDSSLADGAAYEVLGDLRMLDEARLTPVVVTGRDDASEEEVSRALLAGADDFALTTRLRETIARIRVQLRNRRDRQLLRFAQAERAELMSAALTDPLTAVGNRRAADGALERAILTESSVLVLLIDIDYFKRINDTYGHAVGDEVLRLLGRTLQRLGREEDMVARYGGEEFLAVLPGAPRARHRGIAERFLRGVRQMRIPPELGLPGITASVGAASWDVTLPRPSIDEVLECADAALYAAKRGGRDALVFRSCGAMPIAQAKAGAQ